MRHETEVTKSGRVIVVERVSNRGWHILEIVVALACVASFYVMLKVH